MCRALQSPVVPRDDRRLSRRSLVGLLSGAVVGGLAGCSGDGSETPTRTTGSESDAADSPDAAVTETSSTLRRNWPQVTLNVDLNAVTDEVSMEHVGGDGLTSGETGIVVVQESGGDGSVTIEPGGDRTFSVSEVVTIDLSTDPVGVSGAWGGFDVSGTTGFDFDSGDRITLELRDVETGTAFYEETLAA